MEWTFDVEKDLAWPPLEQPLVDTLHWKAAFESYDREQHRCRYQVQLLEGTRHIVTRTADLPLSRAPVVSGEDPEIVKELRTRLDRFAVRLAIAEVERLDWVLRLAFGATQDHSEAIYRGFLPAKHARQFPLARKILWPVITPLDVIGARFGGWEFDATSEQVGGRLTGLILGIVPVFVLDLLVIEPNVDPDVHSLVLKGMYVGAGIVLGQIVIWLRARSLRRKLAATDDAAALRIVLDEITRIPPPNDTYVHPATRKHLLNAVPEHPTTEEIALDRIGAQLES